MDAARLVRNGLALLPRGPYRMGGLAWLVDAKPPTPDLPGKAVFIVSRSCDVAALARVLTGSKAGAARILANRQLMRVNGAPFPATGRAVAGEEVLLRLMPQTSDEPPLDEPVLVLHEDTFLLGVEKPKGLLVHGDGTGADTLAALALGHLRREGSGAVPQAIHRLDVETTGIVLFSLATETQAVFDAMVASDGMTKRYYALIRGRLPVAGRSGWVLVEAPIARDRHDARRMRVGNTGKPASTRLRVVEYREDGVLVEAEIMTGRRHQIRVHLAHLGCPIVGDELYGGAPSDYGLHLHAHEVRLTHPISGRRLILESPCPW